jgi:hypothetical protein
MFDEKPKKMSEQGDGAGPHVVELTGRQVSLVLAFIVLLCFFSFIAGYFLGQRKVFERFSEKVEQDLLADAVASSMYSMYGEGESPDAEVADEPVAETEGANALKSEDEDGGDQEEAPAVALHYAELAGFGSLKAAHDFAQRLQHKDIEVEVKKRDSKTARGKIISWYQVVTKSHASKESLAQQVEQLKKEEHLKDVHIVTCT